jgi:hypothetical protein
VLGNVGTKQDVTVRDQALADAESLVREYTA